MLRKTATKIASAQPQAATKPSQAEQAGESQGSAKPSPRTETTQTPVKIDLETVRDALGRQKFFQESAARTATPGVATGLAVTGAGGDVLFVEATAMKTAARAATAWC